MLNRRKLSGWCGCLRILTFPITNAPLPAWHKATPQVREIAAKAARHAAVKGSDIAKLALQFSIRNRNMATCIVGSANPANVEAWAKWAA